MNQKLLSNTTMKNITLTLFIICSSLASKALEPADTAKKVLLAEAKTTPESKYFIKEANVIFPDILKGNEEESLKYIETFSSNRRAYLMRTYTRGKKLFPKVNKIFSKYQVPKELAILLALESAYNANAVSSAGAVGYWQIMDFVAKEFGMKYVPQLTPEEKKKIQLQNPHKADSIFKAYEKKQDDRKHFVKSTTVAARYLKDRLRNLNNDILLVVASYNYGVGNVWEAMQRTGKANPTFWDIKKYLPAETKAYVMNFITLNVIFHNYESFAKNKLIFSPQKIQINNMGKNDYVCE